VLLRAQGCEHIAIARGVERPCAYVPQVSWRTTVDDHVAFTKTEAFNEFRSLVAHHFAEKPQMEHFTPLVGGDVTK
jgi:hypothetical protein